MAPQTGYVDFSYVDFSLTAGVGWVYASRPRGSLTSEIPV